MTVYQAPDLAALTPFGRMKAGLRYAWWGMRLVVTRTALWPYVVAPILVTVVLFAGAGLVLWNAIGWGLAFLWQPGPETSAWLVVAWFVLRNLLRAVALLAVGVTLYFLAGLLATPFVDRLSEHVETMVLGPYEEEFSLRVLLGDLSVSVAHSLLSLALWLVAMFLAFATNAVPGVGQVVSFVAGVLVSALFLAREAMDGPLSRRRMTYGHKVRVLWRDPWLTLGFGFGCSALMWIPFVNFLVLPMTVAGGTLLLCHLEQQGLVPPARGQARWIPNRARRALPLGE